MKNAKETKNTTYQDLENNNPNQLPLWTEEEKKQIEEAIKGTNTSYLNIEITDHGELEGRYLVGFCIKNSEGKTYTDYINALLVVLDALIKEQETHYGKKADLQQEQP